jgi:hypothetical protein
MKVVKYDSKLPTIPAGNHQVKKPKVSKRNTQRKVKPCDYDPRGCTRP